MKDMVYEELNKKIYSEILFSHLDFSSLTCICYEVDGYICAKVTASEDTTRVITNTKKLLAQNVSNDVSYACEELLRVIDAEAA